MTSKASCISRQATLIFLLVIVLQQMQSNAFHQPRTVIGRLNTRLRILPLDDSGQGKDVDATNPGRRDSDDGDGIYYEDDLQQMSSQPDQIPQIRQSRMARETAIRNRFASGQELIEIREDRHQLQENLRWSQAAGDVTRVRELKAAIKRLEEKDPDFVYANALREMTKAEAIKDLGLKEFVIKQCRIEAEMARTQLQRFHLEGLWVGK